METIINNQSDSNQAQHQPYALYLDDCRNPLCQIENLPWVIARNYDEFKQALLNHGLPDFVSLDHDLYKEHMLAYFHMIQNGLNKIDYSTFEEKTGLDCCEYLINYILTVEEYPRFPINLHTHNKFGLLMMYDLLRKELQYPKITSNRLEHEYVPELIPTSLR